jgi:hypothetical protein
VLLEKRASHRFVLLPRLRRNAHLQHATLRSSSGRSRALSVKVFELEVFVSGMSRPFSGSRVCVDGGPSAAHHTRARRRQDLADERAHIFVITALSFFCCVPSGVDLHRQRHYFCLCLSYSAYDMSEVRSLCPYAPRSSTNRPPHRPVCTPRKIPSEPTHGLPHSSASPLPRFVVKKTLVLDLSSLSRCSHSCPSPPRLPQ